MTAARAAEAKFTITYDGPAVQAGRMDAQALGSAILSMARLLETAAALTFEATANVEVDVVADFRQGSFSFDVVAAGGLGREILESIDMGHLLAILGLTGGGGLIGLIRWLRNRKVRALERAADNSMRVVTEDGDSTAIQAQTVVLLQKQQRSGASGRRRGPASQRGNHRI